MKKEMNIENEANIKIEKDENTKKSTNEKIGVILGIILAIVVAVVIAIGVKVLVIGNKATIDFIAFDTISVEGNKLILHGEFIDSISGCTKVKARENDGVVTIDIYEAPTSIFTKNEIVLEKEFDNSIDTIYVGEHIIYDYRVVIEKKVAKVYAERTSYVGDISEVNELIRKLEIGELFDIKNTSLQTTSEPYGIIFTLDNVATNEIEDRMTGKMKAFSSVLIACIDNLGSVTWKYKKDEETQTIKVTSDEASNFIGESIKDTALIVSKLQRIMVTHDLIDLVEEKEYWEEKVKEYELYGETTYYDDEDVENEEE